jgi:hypothetical protein
LHGYAVCLPAAAPHRRQRTRLRRRGLSCEDYLAWGHICEDSKSYRDLCEIRFYPFVCLSSDLVNSIEIQGKIRKMWNQFC